VQGRKLKIALVQSGRQRYAPEKNLSETVKRLQKLDAADIVCLPEVWLGGVVYTEKEMSRLLEDLASIAKEKRFVLLTGGLLEKRNGKVFDVCHVIDKEQGVPGEQIKLFPSAAVGERGFLDGGPELAVFHCDGVSLGILVCVDMMYPELARALALSGAEVIFNPANIPDDRNPLWHGLIRTRAAENTVFVAYVNNTGTTYLDGRPVTGRSMVASPSGDILAAAGEEAKIITLSLDFDLVEKQRRRWPYLQDVKDSDRDLMCAFPLKHIGISKRTEDPSS